MKKAVLIGMLLSVTLSGCSKPKEVVKVTPAPTRATVITSIATPTPTQAPSPTPTPEPTIVEDPIEKVMFRVTAYCSCEKCCGIWATKRPLDENGVPIVYGASGAVLTEAVSCASPLPFGTEVTLDGIGTVVVEDRIAQWVVDKYGENLIDIYFSDHQKAVEFGLQYVEGVIVE